jgi:hypothetical protein
MNRRTLLSSAAGGLASGRAGYGRPLQRRLELRVANPDAPVVDARMATPRPASNEFPPTVVETSRGRLLFIGTNHSVAVPLAPGVHILKEPGCALAAPPVFSIGGIVHEMRLGRLPMLYDIPTREYWRHTYCGAFDLLTLPASGSRPEWVYAINHCENKNLSFKTRFTRIYTTNSVNPADEATPATTSGSLTGEFRDYQPAYFGFVSMAYAPVTAETKWGGELFHHDQGPILWPPTGMMTPDGSRKHPQYRNPHPHPSALLAEDPKDGKPYIYVFAVDSGQGAGDGTMVMAARAPLTSHGLPGAFLNYYRGEYSEPSLPADMRQDIAELRTLPGGRCDPIHPDLDGTTVRPNRFFVARMRRSGLFLSVEAFSYAEGGRTYYELGLRLSEDLRVWSRRFPVPGTRTERGAKTGPLRLAYPKFLGGDGHSHHFIDETETFYILGTKPYELAYRELRVSIG